MPPWEEWDIKTGENLKQFNYFLSTNPTAVWLSVLRWRLWDESCWGGRIWRAAYRGHFDCSSLRLRGINSKTAFQRTGHPHQRGCRHFTIFPCTQQVLKEKQGQPTWPFLDWLHPPGSFDAKAWCMLGVCIQAQEGASNRNGRPRIWNKKKE